MKIKSNISDRLCNDNIVFKSESCNCKNKSYMRNLFIVIQIHQKTISIILKSSFQQCLGYNFLTIGSTDRLNPFLELTDSNLFGLYYVIFSSKAILIYKIIFKEENIHAKFTFFKPFFGKNSSFIYLFELGFHYYYHNIFMQFGFSSENF